ncbi:hypothetical protein HN747_03265 [archaeon]|jgi:hypothetical protein|nr:hypothetical protein [archaeon]
MNRGIWFLCGLLFLSLVVAEPTINMDSSTVLGETIFGVVEMGDNVELLGDSIEFIFKKGRKGISPNYEMIRYKEDYYFYIYPSSSGDYSLEIQGILYREGNSTQSIDLLKNFSVLDSTENILSVKPGFVYSSGSEITITLTNKGNNSLSVSTTSGDYSLDSLGTIELEINPSYEFSLFEINSYKTFKVPVIYYGGTDAPYIPVNNTDVEDDDLISFEVSPSNLSIALNSFDKVVREFSIENTGRVDLEDISITSDYNFSESNITIKRGRTYDFEIEFDSSDSEGGILIMFNGASFNIPVEISFNESLLEEDETCADLGGRFCLETQNLTCGSGESTYSSDSFEMSAVCCLDECIAISVKSGSGGVGAVIGWVLFLVLGAVGFFVYKKYKEVGKIGSNKRIAEEQNIKKQESVKK